MQEEAETSFTKNVGIQLQHEETGIINLPHPYSDSNCTSYNNYAARDSVGLHDYDLPEPVLEGRPFVLLGRRQGRDDLDG